jgi:cobalt/nickel transport system permease protein
VRIYLSNFKEIVTQIFAFANICYIICIPAFNLILKGVLMFLKRVLKRFPRWMLMYYTLIALWSGTTAMHIPDGYLSPVACILMAILVLPFWIRGVQKLREKITARNIPLVALFAAFSFVVMMFNVPLPGGTTGHAVGGALAAIILGPEIATIAISIALVIQAFFFGDGGILAIGANCFNMAVVLPYVSFAIYQAVSRNMPLNSKRRIVGAAVGGWAGLTVASFFAAVEFGVQPLLWHTADGTPLYAPYPLSVSIPAMVIPHALIASVVEAAATALIIAYLIRANQPALEIVNQTQIAAETSSFARWRALWVGLAALIVITPVGLLAPGTAWGEWGAEELTKLGLSFVPKGLAQISGLWSAPMPDYAVPALGNANLAYILSAVVGILITIGVVWLFSMLATSGKKTLPEAVNSK